MTDEGRLVVVALANAAWFPVVQTVLAWGFLRLPAGRFRAAAPAAWEADGRLYERGMRIRAWKDLLPDGAAWFGGGFRKARLASADAGYLRRYCVEARRGECCHWTALALTPVVFLWNPLWADGVMALAALALNLPCILVQRYNRARLLAVLARKGG